jgi:hypothetical protein
MISFRLFLFCCAHVPIRSFEIYKREMYSLEQQHVRWQIILWIKRTKGQPIVTV